MSTGRKQARRILVVDDSDESRDALARFLELKGHDVCTAQDGLDGLRVAGQFAPEIIFVDLFMPRMDGFELCARLKACDETDDAAVLALTGHMAEGLRRSRRRCAFDAYLGKPLDFDVIESLINTVTR